METRSGTYDVTTSATFLEESLGLYPYTVFDCEMQIPGTHYTKRKTFLYFPGKRKFFTILVPHLLLYSSMAFKSVWINDIFSKLDWQLCLYWVQSWATIHYTRATLISCLLTLMEVKELYSNSARRRSERVHEKIEYFKSSKQATVTVSF